LLCLRFARRNTVFAEEGEKLEKERLAKESSAEIK
jgi:hypothetical protein